MRFIQDPSKLGHQYSNDARLRSYLDRVFPQNMRAGIEEGFRDLGELGGRYFNEYQRRDRLNEPELLQRDPRGHRVDHIEVSPLWKEAEALTARQGLVAVTYEQKNGDLSRIRQFELNYLVQPSLDVYSCPLAMTDGAARALVVMGNPELIQRALPHQTLSDPKTFWTSGQWMMDDGADLRHGRRVTPLYLNFAPK